MVPPPHPNIQCDQYPIHTFLSKFRTDQDKHPTNLDYNFAGLDLCREIGCTLTLVKLFFPYNSDILLISILGIGFIKIMWKKIPHNDITDVWAQKLTFDILNDSKKPFNMEVITLSFLPGKKF